MSAPLALAVTSCSKGGEAGSHTIRILNLEDYIYINDPESGYDEEDLVVQFEKYANKKFGYDDVKVVYDTSDTNESEYNDLLTGRIDYDLVCTSDYMLQKFVREGLVTTLDKEALENYNTFASPVIKERLDQISVVKDGKEVYLEDYAVGYMWGTLGLLVNPEFKLMKEAGLSADDVFRDAQNWDILWNKDYKNTASIKNSMRDTYAVALMHGYDSELNSLKLRHQDPSDPMYDDATYNQELSRIFNLTDDATLEMVKAELNNLKDNIFGLEVDSGKQDIVTGKIGLNLAWSGDAVYSMDQAENPELVSNPFELYYSIPENGSNIWFDGWAIPKNDNRSKETYDLAMAFLDFLSDPEIAAKNMDYTGYTSFIGGDSILELVRDWYDIRTDEVYETIYSCSNEECEWESSEYPANGKCPLCDHKVDSEGDSYQVYLTNEVDDFRAVDYLDFIDDVEGHDSSLDDYVLRYFVPYTVGEGEEAEEVEEPADLQDLIDNGDYVYLFDDEDHLTDQVKTYGDLTIVNDPENELEEIDLKYFFNETLEEYGELDMLFYSDCYLPFTNEDGSQNVSVGRQFFCQYPDEATILRCSVMADYGERNIVIVKLWEDFKSNPLPTWAIILIIVEVGLGISIVGYFWLTKSFKKKLRMKRTNEKK